MSKVEIYRPTRADHERLVHFAQAVWPDRNPGFLSRRWWWQRTPAEAAVAVDSSTGEVLGLCGDRRHRVQVFGRERAATSVCDWFLAPAAKGRGIGRALAEWVTNDVDIATTFSFSQAAEASFLKLGWAPETPVQVPLYVSPTPLASVASALRGWRREARVETLAFSSGTFNRAHGFLEGIWQRTRAQLGLALVRDGAFWRDHLALRPERTYWMHIAFQRDQEVPIGLVVTRDLPRNAFPRLGPTRITLVVDVLWDRVHGEIFAHALGVASRDALRRRQEVLLAPLLLPELAETLARCGFTSGVAPSFGLVIPRLRSRFMAKLPPELEVDFSQWAVSALDADFDLAFGADRAD